MAAGSRASFIASTPGYVHQGSDPTIEDIDCFRYALFRDEFTDWLWAYENTGLRLAQLRFYRED